ncbi:hypothetical protein P170DRAFT_286588 [Aspergillus steynii IBT 23096]|uniref:Uncharacterized protein n=1 Tax=Aspergillus steynii IBT 23096 TaxID=1392250 RepID=A0A2I2FV59_9EURO|nr:uncharacterized protein P170DRAFT_286588 [Aspergillus steynii IBT 23096]PLB44456.1 hypothetical protein P170DRAFT_286588 [Aspergillus steynii IBT 23096]
MGFLETIYHLFIYLSSWGILILILVLFISGGPIDCPFVLFFFTFFFSFLDISLLTRPLSCCVVHPTPHSLKFPCLFYLSSTLFLLSIVPGTGRL